MAYPYKGRFIVSQPFLNKNDIYESGIHFGIDLVGLDNEKRIYAVKSGIVHSITTHTAFGYSVIVKLDGLYVRYSHLSQINVKNGDYVREGVTQIGVEGKSGNVYGYDPRHLDLRISKHPYHTLNTEDYINPAEYLGFPNIDNHIINPLKEDEEIMKNLVVANNGIDEKIAWYLSWKLDAPLIHTEDVKQEHIDKSINIFEIGGEKKIEKSTHISGKDRYETAQKVLDYINTL